MIAGLICRQCWSLTEANASHWLTSDCGSIHPGIVATTLKRQRGRPSLDHLSVTQILGKVREEAIKLLDIPTYPEAQGMADMALGNYVDEMANEGMKELGWLTQVRLKGEFWGIPFTGRLDATIVGENTRFINDTKFTSEGELYRQKESSLARKESSAQVSMYGTMTPILDPERGVTEDFIRDWLHATSTEGGIWLGAKVKAVDWKTKEFRESWHPQRTQPMRIEDIESLFPGGAGTTAKRNAEILWNVIRLIREGKTTKEDILSAVPLSCESAYGGTSCRCYCGANRVCLEAAGRSLSEKKIIKVILPASTWKTEVAHV